MTSISYRTYRNSDYQRCLDVFDANCPEFFAPNERDDYERFLGSAPSTYEVCELGGRVVGAFGLFDDGVDEKSLNWILLDPQTHGVGLGKKMMERVVFLAGKSKALQVKIAASHKSAPFFAKFGATIISTTTDGWGPGMHRLDMVLLL
jgi:GNAT superfamily N-acetyltransferase